MRGAGAGLGRRHEQRRAPGSAGATNRGAGLPLSQGPLCEWYEWWEWCQRGSFKVHRKNPRHRRH
ncbi:MAG: hypothetical protein M3273_01940, partial [Actinomycetota bacterium]|nr:hypothetical protein [Actinomycetota bacterium]